MAYLFVVMIYPSSAIIVVRLETHSVVTSIRDATDFV